MRRRAETQTKPSAHEAITKFRQICWRLSRFKKAKMVQGGMQDQDFQDQNDCEQAYAIMRRASHDDESLCSTNKDSISWHQSSYINPTNLGTGTDFCIAAWMQQHIGKIQGLEGVHTKAGCESSQEPVDDSVEGKRHSQEKNEKGCKTKGTRSSLTNKS